MSKEREILEAKITAKMEMNRNKIQSVLDVLQTDNKGLNDTVVFSNQFKFKNAGELTVNYGSYSSKLGKFATKQMANRLGIPTNYLHKLAGEPWGQKLMTQILNDHAKNIKPERFLLRSINDEVRGVLSDSYKRINSMDIFTAFLTSAATMNTKLFDAAIDDTKIFLDIIKPEIVTIDTPKNGNVDIVFGAQIRNSDFGDGSLNVKTYMLNVVCLNGMLGTKVLSEIHRGAKLPENMELSEKTYQLETAASASAVTDSLNHVFNNENIKAEIERINRASDNEINFDTQIKQLKRSKHYSDFELKSLANKLMNNNPQDGVTGKNTKWKFVQGLTSVANDALTTRKNEIIEYASELY